MFNVDHFVNIMEVSWPSSCSMTLGHLFINGQRDIYTVGGRYVFARPLQSRGKSEQY